jgi:indole-3-glycerol phosphate synthase
VSTAYAYYPAGHIPPHYLSLLLTIIEIVRYIMATGRLKVNRDIILATKRQHLQARQEHTPYEAVMALARMQRRPRHVLNVSGDGNDITLIAQVRRQEIYDPVTSALQCVQAGADAISFFTDHSIYDRDLDDMLMVARGVPDTPVIYQNYVMNEYGVMAARGSDASALMLYASLLEPATLRSVVSMTQRWKMTSIVQVNDTQQLEIAHQLSPQALAFGDPLQGKLSQTVDTLHDLRPQLPPHYRVLLSHSVESLEELEHALSVDVDAVIVDEELLKSDRTLPQVQQQLQQAESRRDT